MVLGNLSSNSVDSAASQTRLLLRGMAPVPHLLACLTDKHSSIRVYAAAALQNICQDEGLALVAVESGVVKALDTALKQTNQESCSSLSLAHARARTRVSAHASHTYHTHHHTLPRAL